MSWIHDSCDWQYLTRTSVRELVATEQVARVDASRVGCPLRAVDAEREPPSAGLRGVSGVTAQHRKSGDRSIVPGSVDVDLCLRAVDRDGTVAAVSVDLELVDGLAHVTNDHGFSTAIATPVTAYFVDNATT